MKTIDVAPLLALPDEAFIAEAWAGFAPSGQAVPQAVVLAVHACESRTLVLVRIWIAAIALDPSMRQARLVGPGTGAANLAARLPGGLGLLRLGLQTLGNLTGRRTDRLAIRSRDLSLRLAQAEQRIEQLAHLVTVTQHTELRLQARVDALARELTQAVEQQLDPAILADDLTRRVDLLAFEMRQAVDAAVLSAQERQSLSDAAQGAARHLRP